jgi:hypothetical protein
MAGSCRLFSFRAAASRTSAGMVKRVGAEISRGASLPQTGHEPDSEARDMGRTSVNEPCASHSYSYSGMSIPLKVPEPGLVQRV